MGTDSLVRTAARALGGMATTPTGALDDWADSVAVLAHATASRLADAESEGRPLAPYAPLSKAQALATAIHAAALAALDDGSRDGLTLDRNTYLAAVATLGGMLEAVAPRQHRPDTLTAGDVPLSDGRTLRAGLEPDGTLIVAVGTGRGREWREDPSEGVQLPPGTLVALRDALSALALSPAHPIQEATNHA